MKKKKESIKWRWSHHQQLRKAFHYLTSTRKHTSISNPIHWGLTYVVQQLQSNLLASAHEETDSKAYGIAWYNTSWRLFFFFYVFYISTPVDIKHLLQPCFCCFCFCRWLYRDSADVMQCMLAPSLFIVSSHSSYSSESKTIPPPMFGRKIKCQFS